MNRQAEEFLNALRDTTKGLATGLGLIFALAVTPLQAAPQKQDMPSQVAAAINHYIHGMQEDSEARIVSTVQPVDPRLQLAVCDKPLKIQPYPRQRTTGHLTFKVRCQGSSPWTIHVPAVIQTFEKVIVAAGGIPMGAEITADDVTRTEMDVSTLRQGYYKDATTVTGLIAKRPIPAGQVLTPVTVKPANIVSKGETVAILAQGPGITIRATGVSMMNGALGQLIRVRNTNSNKVVEGRISAPGQIKVSL